MRFKALGAAAALILVSTAFATVTFLRVQARGYAIDPENRRLDFQLSVLKRSQGDNHRYLGNGSFAWSEQRRGRAMRIHRIESVDVNAGEGSVVITASGKGVLGQFGFPPIGGRRGAPELGDFTLTIVDNEEGNDTIEFSFQRGTGVNAYNYNFSGVIREGVLNCTQWSSGS
jgi:hypothetical protein